MLTYSDWEKTTNKAAFIIAAINEHKSSDTYKNAVIAQKYYARENVEILKRMSAIERKLGKDMNVISHKLCMGFFPKAVKQLSQYLVGNGVTLSKPANKTNLGVKFDKDLQRATMQALVDSVNWGFWNYDRLMVYRATEFAPIFDETTADLMVGIRFWQIDDSKPMYIELYEIDGITRYKTGDNAGALERIDDKIAYKQKIRTDAISTQVVDTENYPRIPVFPLYANELRKSEFTGLKAMIDAYDFINSDLADGITQIEGVYWVIRNFGGEDERELIKTLQEWKAIVQDDENANAESHVVELPYQAKQAALDLLRKQMFSDFMALDITAIQGGSLTNVAINVSKTDLDLKADVLEWQVSDFVDNILSLIGVEGEIIQFKRRSITNDSETIANISMMLSDGYIDQQFAVEICPLIPDESKKDLLDRLALAEQELANEAYPLDGEDDAALSTEQVEGEVQETAGKSLNGAQTQSLIAVLGQYAAGSLALGQAVNVVSVAIGISKEEAKSIIEGLD